MKDITVKDLIGRYEAVLIDAYGVLVNQQGALPGANAFLSSLEAANKPYFVLTNDASRLPETIVRRFKTLGLSITVEHVVTSGQLLVEHFERNGLKGKRCVVLGSADSVAYAERAGGRPVPATEDADAEVLVVCDDSGFEPFLETLDAALSMAMRRIDHNLPMHLVLCNPDLIYPKGPDSYGFTSGSIALLIESAIRMRHTHDAVPQFAKLGKPYAPIFEAAARRAGTRKLVLLGDQLATDIRGAADFGIDSVLVGTGLTHIKPDTVLDPDPTWYLPAVAGA